MSMTEKEIQELYRYWDNNPNVFKKKLHWYQRVWEKISNMFKGK